MYKRSHVCVRVKRMDIFDVGERRDRSRPLAETIYRSTFVLLPGNWKVFIDIVAGTREAAGCSRSPRARARARARRFREILLHADTDISSPRRTSPGSDVFTSGATIPHTAKLLSDELHARRFGPFSRTRTPERSSRLLPTQCFVSIGYFVFIGTIGEQQ